MEILFSHVVAFSVLFTGAVFDLRTTEVPDLLNLFGIGSGILLHLYASLEYMQPDILLSAGILISSPVEWFLALGEPLAWCLAVGTVFSIYGWISYLLGLWGGADAFAMSVLGFAAPYSLSGFAILYPVNIFVAVILIGFLYTVFFSIRQAVKNRQVLSKTFSRLKRDEKRISLEVVAAALVSAFAATVSLRAAIIYYVSFLGLIVLLRLLKVIQEESMNTEIEVEELEVGEIVSSEEIDFEEHQAREKNVFGRGIEWLRSLLPGNQTSILRGIDSGLELLEERIGYPEIVGITEEQVRELQEKDVDTVRVKTGIKFVPVFPLALLLVDFAGFNIFWLVSLLS